MATKSSTVNRKRNASSPQRFALPIAIGAIVILLLIIIGMVKHQKMKYRGYGKKPAASGTYNPDIDPKQFSSSITNTYFQLTPGKKMVYRGVTGSGEETIETYVTHDKKTVMGVETTVVWDRVWLNGELQEDTRDWFAQDTEGNVWYFGEESKDMSGGRVVSTHGSWEAGVDGALPGIIMKASPRVGETLQEEYYAGEAEDRADILDIDASASVPFGTFDECVQTKNYTPLEPAALEHKYYCPDAGGIVLETDEDNERVELRSIEFNAQPSTGEYASQTVTQPSQQPVSAITEAQAKATALKRVPGTVTDVAIEIKSGRRSYVVEIAPAGGGSETDVVIDMTTGEILEVEN